MKVELIPSKKIRTITIDEVRKKVLSALRKDRGFWESGDDYEEIVQSVENAPTIKQIIESIPD